MKFLITLFLFAMIACTSKVDAYKMNQQTINNRLQENYSEFHRLTEVADKHPDSVELVASKLVYIQLDINSLKNDSVNNANRIAELQSSK